MYQNIPLGGYISNGHFENPFVNPKYSFVNFYGYYLILFFFFLRLTLFARPGAPRPASPNQNRRLAPAERKSGAPRSKGVARHQNPPANTKAPRFPRSSK